MALSKFKSIDQLRDLLTRRHEFKITYKGKGYQIEGYCHIDWGHDKTRYGISPLEPDGVALYSFSFDEFADKFKAVYGVTLQEFLLEAEMEFGSIDIDD